MTAQAKVRPAADADRPDVERLLIAERLPLAGLADHFEHFMVAELDGTIIATAGLEVYGRDALLRSVVVTAAHRNARVAQLLLKELLKDAHRQQLRALYLLTTNAEDYFARLGFSRVQREHVPETVKQSREFVDACPASATAMRYMLAIR